MITPFLPSFDEAPPAGVRCNGPAPVFRVDLDQWMTPAWAARELWKAFFADLGARDLVLEPTCGDGRMLSAVPAHVPAVGIEINPELAAAARERTGRRVIAADVLAADLPQGVTAVWGNLST